MKVERGQQPPRMHLPAKVWKRPPRVASDLEPLGMYLLLPDEVPVYATTLLDGWYLVGEERSFSVAEDGTVTEHTEGARAGPPLTLNDFEPTFKYMSRCPYDGALNDWSHSEVCEGY